MDAERGLLVYPNAVAEWPPMESAGLVLSHGVNYHTACTSRYDGGKRIEAIVASLLMGFSSSGGGGSTAVGRAVQRHIVRLLSSHLNDDLLGLDLLVLARLLYHLISDVAKRNLIGSITMCLDVGEGSGIASIPKLMAKHLIIIWTRSYCLISARRSYVSIFEAKIRDRIKNGGEDPSSWRKNKNQRQG